MAKHSRFFLIIFCLFMASSCQRCQIKKSPITTENPWSEVVAYAHEHLPKEGVLIQNSDGYAYLKVDDDYIHELFLRLHADASFKKPPYFRRSDSPGAHISVVYEDERVKLAEAGERFSFKLNDIKVVDVNDTTSYIVLQVTAPDLEKLRQHYGLSPKLKNHEFHITLAKKVKR